MLRPYILTIFMELEVWSTCTAQLATPWRWPGYMAETCRNL